MFRNLDIAGHEGRICWGHVGCPAVVFSGWRYEGSQAEGTLTAQVVSCDEYRVSQDPLVAIVSMGRADWRWSVTDLQMNGTALTARVVRQ
jgi:hypothetical protein